MKLTRLILASVLATTFTMADGQHKSTHDQHKHAHHTGHHDKTMPPPEDTPAPKRFSVDVGVLGGIASSRFDNKQNSTAVTNDDHGHLKIANLGADGGLFARGIITLRHQFFTGLDLSGGISSVQSNAKTDVYQAGTPAYYKTKRDYFLAADVLLGRQLEGFAPYVKIGYGYDHWQLGYAENNGAQTTKKTALSGINIGVGAIMHLTPKISLGLEIVHTASQKKDLVFPIQAERMRIRHNTTRGLIKLSYKLI